MPEGEKLYTGAYVEIESPDKNIEKKKIIRQGSIAIKPKPNGKILGLKIKLWIYNIVGPVKKEKGLKYWIKNKLGEPPVLLSEVNPTAISEIINARVFNIGYFKSSTSYEVIQNNNKTKAAIKYKVFPGDPFIIDSLTFDKIKDTAIKKIIKRIAKRSLIKKGDTYDLDLLKSERARIDERLKNKGYYYFSPDYLYFKIDSSSKDNSLDIYLSIKEDVPPKALIPYTINKVTVTIDSTIYDDTYFLQIDTLLIDSVHYVNHNKSFRPKAIVGAVFLKEGSLYSTRFHNLSLSRLGSLGVFKFVNLKIDNDSVNRKELNVSIELNPLPRNSISSEIQAATKSNNFMGPAVNLGYMNRNLFKGAEKLNVSLNGSIETQLNGQFKGLYTYQFGPQVKLTFPKFILPFNAVSNKLFSPSTQFMVDYNYIRRINYFEMKSLKFSLDYRWKESRLKDHMISPINITYLKIDNISNDFQKLLDFNPFLKQRYEDQLIAGSTYSFTYNEQLNERKINQIFFNGNIDIAGNTVSLLSNVFKTETPSGTPKKFGGVAYAQYARFDIDLREFYNIKEKTKFATRVVFGVGIPYGNSNTLPYLRGFFVGGTNSIRAFTVNSVGPGTYQLPDSLKDTYYIQQGGDIKIEWSGEYRFPIWGFLRGGVFLDVGNVWLLKKNNLLKGGEFDINKFYSQFAIGTGMGLRADFNFFVIRLDLGIPLRKPWLPQNDRWVIDKIDFGKPEWRNDNLILNIALGYPF